MIAVPRSKIADLPHKVREFLENEARKAEKFFSQPLKARAQKRFPFADLDRRPDLKKLLLSEFDGKCAYSESPITPANCTIIRHRPEGGVIGENSEVARDHYWWLAYEWENLIPVRREIARAKGNHFPVIGPRGRVGTSIEGLRSTETTIIPDPSDPKMEFHPGHTLKGEFIGSNEMEDQAIKILGLNLFDIRKERRQAITAHGSEVKISAEPKLLEPENETFRPLTLTHLHIHNFRGIYSLKIEFPQKEHLEEGEAPFGLMVLGENGSGKSTILQAIALALEEPEKVHDNPFLAIRKILRRGTKDGFVRLSILDHPEPIEVRFARGQRKCRFSGPRESLRFFFRAYGAHRLLPRFDDDRPLPKDPGPIAINNLWDPYESLIDAEKWILAQKKVFFDLFALALKDLLNLGNDGKIYRDKKQLRFDIGQRDLALDELSAGYQSVIATATDIIAGYPIQGIDMQNASGVVLIDEIGAHLHPSWRMRIVHAYRRTFPKIQFISTTHEPLCLRGVRQEELLVLEKKNSTIRPIENLPELESMRVDQILTSPIFGLNTTIDPDVEEKFQEYYALLRKDTPSKKNQKRIDELRTHLYRYGVLGSSRRARAIYDIIDKNLAIGNLEGQGVEISDNTRKLVRDLWTNSDLEDLK